MTVHVLAVLSNEDALTGTSDILNTHVAFYYELLPQNICTYLWECWLASERAKGREREREMRGRRLVEESIHKFSQALHPPSLAAGRSLALPHTPTSLSPYQLFRRARAIIIMSRRRLIRQAHHRVASSRVESSNAYLLILCCWTAREYWYFDLYCRRNERASERKSGHKLNDALVFRQMPIASTWPFGGAPPAMLYSHAILYIIDDVMSVEKVSCDRDAPSPYLDAYASRYSRSRAR